MSSTTAEAHPYRFRAHRAVPSHTTSGKIRKQLGLWFAEPVWADAFTFEMMNGEQVKKGDPIFPRLDIEKELEELEACSTARKRKNIA